MKKISILVTIVANLFSATAFQHVEHKFVSFSVFTFKIFIKISFTVRDTVSALALSNVVECASSVRLDDFSVSFPTATFRMYRPSTSVSVISSMASHIS